MVGLDIPVILIVSDGFDTGSQTVTVKITSYWPPEIRKYMPDVSFYEDQQVINAFTLNNFFSDKDSDTLYYSYGQKYLNITIHSNSSVDFTAEKNWYGVETVTFRATDFTNAFVETVITVTVIPVNDPPIIKPVPLLKVMAKEFLKFDLSHFIDDIDNDITDLVINVTSDKLEVFITGRELVIYSDSAIIEQITLTVTDGQQETSETILVEVQEDKSEPNKSDDFIMSILWLLILLIIIIISLTGYASLRRYIGNYEIEEVYWIMDDGILVTHINYQNKKHNADEDIVSGMLTAILDFSEDAFSEVGQSKKGCKIKEIKMENKNILVERGKYTFLATVFSGRSGQRLYSNSGQVMKMVESRYGKILYSWSGDINLLIGSKFIIKSILKPANSGHRNRKRN